MCIIYISILKVILLSALKSSSKAVENLLDIINTLAWSINALMGPLWKSWLIFFKTYEGGRITGWQAMSAVYLNENYHYAPCWSRGFLAAGLQCLPFHKTVSLLDFSKKLETKVQTPLSWSTGHCAPSVCEHRGQGQEQGPAAELGQSQVQIEAEMRMDYE